MASRHLAAALAATVLGTVHYVVAIGELTEAAGWRALPGAVERVIELGLLGSIAILLAFLLPRALRFNILMSRWLLAALAWCGDLADRSLEGLRWGMIVAAERTAARLRSGQSDESDSPPRLPR